MNLRAEYTILLRFVAHTSSALFDRPYGVANTALTISSNGLTLYSSGRQTFRHIFLRKGEQDHGGQN